MNGFMADLMEERLRSLEVVAGNNYAKQHVHYLEHMLQVQSSISEG